MGCNPLNTLLRTTHHTPRTSTHDRLSLKTSPHLYPPIPTLSAAASRLERIPLEHFEDVPTPRKIAVVTWTDRSYHKHTRRNLQYCKRWNYTCIVNSTRTLPRLPQTFEKLPLVRWALTLFDAVLQVDDDASVYRQHQPIADFLRTFPTSSLIASSAGWDVPVGPGRTSTTWDVPSTVHPQKPEGAMPAAYSLQAGLLLWRRSAYAATLLEALLEDGARNCVPYARRCCFEQDALIASTRSSWMLHIGLLPMHAFNCFPGDLNTYGRCVEPFVLHIAGKRSKNKLNRKGLLGRWR